MPGHVGAIDCSPRCSTPYGVVSARRGLRHIDARASSVRNWAFRNDAAPERAVTDAAPGRVQIPFTQIAEQAGLDFVHRSGAMGQKLLPETMGGGAAFFDYDNDSDPDLLLVSGGRWPGEQSDAPGLSGTARLYRNDGGAFTDVTEASGLLSLDLYAQGIAVGDFDADNDDDLVITGLGGTVALRNDHGVFMDVTAQIGVRSDPESWTTSAGFFDFDRDGDLDLFVCQYVSWSREIDLATNHMLAGIGRSYGPPFNFSGTQSLLYRNDDGVFIDISAQAGIHVSKPAGDLPVGKALAVTFCDYDRDGWLDIVAANDTEPNFLFRNQGNGAFVESAQEAGVAFDANGGATSGMGIDAAYFRNNDELGIAIGNYANETTSVFVGDGDPPLFADESLAVGVGGPSRAALTFGILWADLDLDGRLDLVQANGHLERQIQEVEQSQRYQQPAQLFWNAGSDAPHDFEALADRDVGDLAQPIAGRSLACADIDGDGDLDLLITQVDGRPCCCATTNRAVGIGCSVVYRGDAATPMPSGQWSKSPRAA